MYDGRRIGNPDLAPSVGDPGVRLEPREMEGENLPLYSPILSRHLSPSKHRVRVVRTTQICLQLHLSISFA